MDRSKSEKRFERTKALQRMYDRRRILWTAVRSKQFQILAYTLAGLACINVIMGDSEWRVAVVVSAASGIAFAFLAAQALASGYIHSNLYIVSKTKNPCVFYSLLALDYLIYVACVASQCIWAVRCVRGMFNWA